MKKVVSLVLAFVIVLGLFPLVHADNGAEFINVNVDGKTVSVRKINVLINGKPLESDVPPMLYNERTLVPVRFIAESLNAKVEWIPDSREVDILSAEKHIVIKIDSSDVIINGETKKMPYNVPAKIINDRTMVPLRFVSEILGHEVGWIKETFTALVDFKEAEIVGISVEEGKDKLPIVSIETTDLVAHSEIHLDEPYRLVIDIPRSRLSIQDEDLLDSKGLLNLEVDKYPIKKIRASQFSLDPEITRFVIELDEFIKYNIQPTSDNKKLVIDFGEKEEDIETEEDNENTETEEDSNINKVESISLEKIDGRTGIVISNTNIPEYNVIRLSNPDRIVLDLKDSVLANDKYEHDIETEFINKIRTSQFEPDSLYNDEDKIVRIVFDIKDSEIKPNLVTESKDNELIVYIDDEKLDNIEYTIENSSAIIKIDAKRITGYNIEYNEETRIMDIEVPKSKLDVKDGMIFINDEIITNISIEEHGSNKNIQIKFKDEISYNIKSKSEDDEILIDFVNKNLTNSQKLIIIDAGHGGKDPGAISPYSKTKEKDLTLKVALKLDKKLRDLGFRTLLTRDKDEYIGLYERSDIANASDGDMFISIHFNAAESKNISGLQTIYCPSYESEVKTEDQYPLAETIHNQLLEELKLVDKRIERRPKLVVTRETKMVAALLELGFLTNQQEEKKIITDEYHDQATQAIANAVVKYFEKKE